MTIKSSYYSMLLLACLVFLFSCSGNIEEPAPVFKLYTPENFTVALADYASVELKWDAVKGAKYKVYYGTQSGVYNGTKAHQGRSPIETENTLMILEGLEIGTPYYFIVTAFSSLGETGPTDERIETPQAPPQPPEAPTGLAATAIDSQSVQLSWNDNSLTEKGYHLYRSLQENQGFEWKADIAAPAEYFVDNDSLSEQTTYYYKITAFNDNGPSGYSNTAFATTLEAPSVPPAAPGNLRVQSYAHNYITIAWDDNASNETGFEVYRSETSSACSANNPYSREATLGPNIQSYQDDGLATEKTYYYCVRAYNEVSPSVFIGPVSQLTDPEPETPPYVPYNLTASRAGADKIDLAWEENSENEEGFLIAWDTSETGDYLDSVSVDVPNTTSYQVQSLDPNTTYWFRVAAYNGAGSSAFSLLASATTGPAVPNAPTLNSATATGPYSVQLVWTDNSSTEEGFNILRSTDDVTYEPVAIVGAGVTTHTDNNGLTFSTNYWYRIEAYNESGSNLSNKLSVATEAPGAPTGLNADGTIAFEEILVTWDEVADAASYKLYYDTSSLVDESSPSITVATNSYNYTGYDICGTRYYFRVRVETPTQSALSNTVSAITKPCEIDTEYILQATPGLNQITVWFMSYDYELPTGYIIEYTNIETGNTYYDSIDAPGDMAQWSGHVINGLTNGARYYIRVTAVNESGEGPPSGDKVAQPGKPAPLGLTKSAVYDCSSKSSVLKMAVPAQVDLTWSPPNTAESITGYHINVQDLSNGEDWFENYNSTTVKIGQGIGKSNWVTIYVTAIYSDGDSASSNVLRFCPCGGCP